MVVVLDLNGVLETPQHQRVLLDHHPVLEQQLPEGFHRQVLPGAGLWHIHAEVLPVPVLVHADGQVGGVVAVIVHLIHLPTVVPLALTDPVVHIAVVGHIAGGQGAVAALGPELVGHPVGFLMAVRPVLRYKAVHFDADAPVRQVEHRRHTGQVNTLTQVKAAVTAESIGEGGKLCPGHYGLPDLCHAVLIQVVVDAAHLP